MPLVLPGNVASAVSGAFEVKNSCRFNDGDSAYLSRTLGTPTDNNVWTFSFWIKRGLLSSSVQLFDSDTGSGDEGYLMINASNAMNWYMYQGSPALDVALYPSRVFRDPSAWMHVVMIYNSPDGTSGNRMQIWINGVRETSFSTETQPGSSAISTINEGKAHRIGAKMDDSRYFDGYLAEVVFIDGSALAPTSFGEYDEDSPQIWKPIDVSGLTFGDNGFYLDFEDSSALGNDVSGNDNDWTANNLAAVDQSTDTPTNNFCTMHPLNASPAVTLSEGNNTVFGNTTSSGNVSGTICPDGGKWYAETKYRTIISNYPRAGQFQINTVFGRALNATAGSPGNLAYECQMTAAGAMTTGASETGGWGSSVSAGGIVQIAIDCDNGATYIGINNTWQNSGDPTSGASKTGAATTWTVGTQSQGATFGDSCYNGSYSDWNFGANGAFAGTAVSSAASDANGYGAFEYAPPSGYLALCTKNLGSDGG